MPEKTLSTAAAHQKIVKAEKDALKRIEDREASALKILTTATAEALKVNNAKTSPNNLDHDTLVKLVGSVENLSINFSEKFKDINADIKDIKDDVAGRIIKLEDYVYEKLEKRVHKLENQVARFWITIGLYTLAVGTMIIMILNHISK